ncbi:MAG: bacillithiol biosynthesis BshC [Candidatus Eisenbacteria bacterium]|nr:bacillithiol biosynthesis BshC [Candidatus Eisenbacteria bacterium]
MRGLIRGNPAQFRFPRLFLDYTAGRFPGGLDGPELLTKAIVGSALGRVAGGADGSEREFWAAVLESDAGLGAGEASLRNIEALGAGRAVAVITGQQPGLLGGPLYTIYKTMTAVALSEHLRDVHGVEAVPVLWNACDDADFLEVSSAGFFTKGLERRKLAVPDGGHTPGRMVGSLGLEPVREALEEVWSQFGDADCRGAAYVRDVTERAVLHARDWGGFFSSLYLTLLERWGLVVVDAREASRSSRAAPVYSAYLRSSAAVEEKTLERLRAVEQMGYEEPVSTRSAESCVFVREGDVRRKPSREEHPRLLAHVEKGDADLLPNVLLGPILRDRLTNPLVHVLGPSEVSYSVVSRVVSSELGFDQGPVLPRLSLTLVPAVLTDALGGGDDVVTETVLSFDKRLQRHVEESLPPGLSKDLEEAESEVRAGLEKLKRLAGTAGRGVEDVTASASRKTESELRRVRDEFVSNAKKKALSANPSLRAGGEFLLPNGNLQERGFCSLAPLLLVGEPFLTDLRELAGVHVEDSLDGRLYHYLFVYDEI